MTARERRRFLQHLDPALVHAAMTDSQAWRRVAPSVTWELLYRLEPDLYERLVAGEHLHPGVLEWLPQRVEQALEIGAGSGRLTLELASRCRQLVAVEPAAPLRRRLARRLRQRGHHNCQTVSGFFDALPVDDGWADLVISCSAFLPDPAHGGEPGLEEMDRVCRPGGLIVIVWPGESSWLRRRGFTLARFPGPMQVEFASVEEAVELARIFYPDAAGRIARERLSAVPYEVLGFEGPRLLAWRRKA